MKKEIINEERVQYPASYVQGKIFAPIQYKPKKHLKANIVIWSSWKFA